MVELNPNLNGTSFQTNAAKYTCDGVTVTKYTFDGVDNVEYSNTYSGNYMTYSGNHEVSKYKEESTSKVSYYTSNQARTETCYYQDTYGNPYNKKCIFNLATFKSFERFWGANKYQGAENETQNSNFKLQCPSAGYILNMDLSHGSRIQSMSSFYDTEELLYTFPAYFLSYNENVMVPILFGDNKIIAYLDYPFDTFSNAAPFHNKYSSIHLEPYLVAGTTEKHVAIPISYTADGYSLFYNFDFIKNLKSSKGYKGKSSLYGPLGVLNTYLDNFGMDEHISGTDPNSKSFKLLPYEIATSSFRESVLRSCDYPNTIVTKYYMTNDYTSHIEDWFLKISADCTATDVYNYFRTFVGTNLPLVLHSIDSRNNTYSGYIWELDGLYKDNMPASYNIYNFEYGDQTTSYPNDDLENPYSIPYMCMTIRMKGSMNDGYSIYMAYNLPLYGNGDEENSDNRTLEDLTSYNGGSSYYEHWNNFYKNNKNTVYNQSNIIKMLNFATFDLCKNMPSYYSPNTDKAMTFQMIIPKLLTNNFYIGLCTPGGGGGAGNSGWNYDDVAMGGASGTNIILNVEIPSECFSNPDTDVEMDLLKIYTTGLGGQGWPIYEKNSETLAKCGYPGSDVYIIDSTDNLYVIKGGAVMGVMDSNSYDFKAFHHQDVYHKTFDNESNPYAISNYRSNTVIVAPEYEKKYTNDKARELFKHCQGYEVISNSRQPSHTGDTVTHKIESVTKLYGIVHVQKCSDSGRSTSLLIRPYDNFKGNIHIQNVSSDDFLSMFDNQYNTTDPMFYGVLKQDKYTKAYNNRDIDLTSDGDYFKYSKNYENMSFYGDIYMPGTVATLDYGDGNKNFPTESVSGNSMFANGGCGITECSFADSTLKSYDTQKKLRKVFLSGFAGSGGGAISDKSGGRDTDSRPLVAGHGGGFAIKFYWYAEG